MQKKWSQLHGQPLATNVATISTTVAAMLVSGSMLMSYFLSVSIELIQ